MSTQLCKRSLLIIWKIISMRDLVMKWCSPSFLPRFEFYEVGVKEHSKPGRPHNRSHGLREEDKYGI